MTRRTLPVNCDPARPEIEMIALLRSSDPQWDAVQRVARSSSELVALGYSNQIVSFTVTTADGRAQDGTIDASGSVDRDTPIAVS
jgi:hypothetical protein